MTRRLASISLLGAWLFAGGAVLDVAQVVAWTRMFAGYVRTESIASAARDTFDPGRPCALCRRVSQARQSCGRPSPALASAGTEKMVLILERATPYVAVRSLPRWPRIFAQRGQVRDGDVPVPPPRAFLA
jgi:hypothetical protein